MSHANVLPYNKEFISSKRAVAAIGVTFFVLATALSAYVRIPVPGSPIPITLQTFFVLLAGAVLGRKLGAASQIGYVLLGAAGLPVFQGAGYGIASLFGPTGGYLMGFVAAAYAVGYLSRSAKPGIARSIAIFSVGSMIIYAFGAAWLVFLYKVQPAHAISIGVLPFIAGDITKILLAAVISSAIARRANTVFSA